MPVWSLQGGRQTPTYESGTQYGWQQGNPWQSQQVQQAYQNVWGNAIKPSQLWGEYLNWEQAPDARFMENILSNLYDVEGQRYASRPSTSPSPPSSASSGGGAFMGPWPAGYMGPYPAEFMGPFPAQYMGPFPAAYRGPFPTGYRGPWPENYSIPSDEGGDGTRGWEDGRRRGGFEDGGQDVPGSQFRDPATTQWEQMTRKLVKRLTQDRPTYTPSQLDLLQTQALDPMERQRQAMKQQVIERYARLGHTMTSGPLQQALLDVDQSFNELRTRQQSAFASQQISREDELFGMNEARALQALGLMKEIPLYADDRLRLALQTLIPSNPAQTLGLFPQFGQLALAQQGQQFNQSFLQQQQSQATWDAVAQMLASIFGAL